MRNIKDIEPQTPDTARLAFAVTTRTVEYGDRRKFVEYRILMRRGSLVVGVEDGPRRETVTRPEALKAARARVRELKSRRLYVVSVTEQHIKDGDARDCHTCAVAQALWHNQERMGFSKYDYDFEVSTYGFMADARGIVLSNKWRDADARAIPACELPEMVTRGRGGAVFTESMMEWTMHWDDWAESRYMSLRDWRERHGYDDDERPWRPSPCSFVLDVDALRPVNAAA